MKSMYSKMLVFILTLAVCVAPGMAVTQQSNIATVSLSATVASSLTVSVSVASLNFTDNNPSPAFNVTTSWNLASGQAVTLDTVAFFNSSTALTGTAGSIPTSSVITLATGGSGTCNQNQVLGGITFANTCGPDVFNINITNANLSGSSTVPLQVQIPTLLSFPPGSYAGVMNIQAIAF